MSRIRIDDCLTMPRLTIHHKTIYRFTRPVAFGEHRLMLRPPPGHELHILAIEPNGTYLGWLDTFAGMEVSVTAAEVGDDHAEVPQADEV
jgi:hypothetical protein